MAPEFFPFLLCGFLVGLIALVALAAVFVQWTRRILEFVFSLAIRFLRPLLLLALIPLVALLLLVGLSVRQQYFLNEPMASAAGAGNIDRVRNLLDRGASPDSWGIDFVYPALISAVDSGRGDVVELLLSRGANPSIRDGQGRSALQHAKAAGREEIVAILLRAGAKE